MSKQTIINNRLIGMSPLTLLGLIFIILKLCGIINWSWWLVTGPFWIPWCIVLSIILAILITVLIAAIWID